MMSRMNGKKAHTHTRHDPTAPFSPASSFYVVIVVKKQRFFVIRTHLDLLSIPQFRWEKISKRLGGIKGCKYKTSSWHLNGFPDGNNILGQQYNIGEKPTVILYTYINRHAGTLEKQ